MPCQAEPRKKSSGRWETAEGEGEERKEGSEGRGAHFLKPPQDYGAGGREVGPSLSLRSLPRGRPAVELNYLTQYIDILAGGGFSTSPIIIGRE